MYTLTCTYTHTWTSTIMHFYNHWTTSTEYFNTKVFTFASSYSTDISRTRFKMQRTKSHMVLYILTYLFYIFLYVYMCDYVMICIVFLSLFIFSNKLKIFILIFCLFFKYLQFTLHSIYMYICMHNEYEWVSVCNKRSQWVLSNSIDNLKAAVRNIHYFTKCKFSTAVVVTS